jgi:hypothetical protein
MLLTNAHLLKILSHNYKTLEPSPDDQYSHIEVIETHFNTFKTFFNKVTDRPNLLGYFFQENVNYVSFPLLVKFTEFKWSEIAMVETGYNQKVMELLELHSRFKVPATNLDLTDESMPAGRKNKLLQEQKEKVAQYETLLALKRYLSYFPFANLYIFMVSKLAGDIARFQKLVVELHNKQTPVPEVA